MKPLIYVLIVIAFLVMISFGCKKNGKSTAPNYITAPYYIAYTGAAIPGSGLKFISIKGGSSCEWNFGDATASKESSPTHAYDHIGTYTVTLVVNGDQANKATVIVNVYDDPVYTHLIAGKRIWSHVEYHYSYDTDTTYFGDTSITINYVDQIRITINNDTMYYYGTDRDTFLNFSHSYNNMGHYTGNWDKISLNRFLNAIQFRKRIHFSAASEYEHVYNSK